MVGFGLWVMGLLPAEGAGGKSRFPVVLLNPDNVHRYRAVQVHPLQARFFQPRLGFCFCWSATPGKVLEMLQGEGLAMKLADGWRLR